MNTNTLTGTNTLKGTDTETMPALVKQHARPGLWLMDIPLPPWVIMM